MGNNNTNQKKDSGKLIIIIVGALIMIGSIVATLIVYNAGWKKEKKDWDAAFKKVYLSDKANGSFFDEDTKEGKIERAIVERLLEARSEGKIFNREDHKKYYNDDFLPEQKKDYAKDGFLKKPYKWIPGVLGFVIGLVVLVMGIAVGGLKNASPQPIAQAPVRPMAPPPAPFPQNVPPPAPVQSAADEIAKYKALLDSGAITQEEYDAKKKKLMDI